MPPSFAMLDNIIYMRKSFGMLQAYRHVGFSLDKPFYPPSGEQDTKYWKGSARSGSNLEGFGQIRSNPDQTSLINYESSSTKCQCETHVMRHCLRELKNTFSFADKSGQGKLSQKKKYSKQAIFLWVGLENAGRKSPVRFRTAFSALSINSKQNIFFTMLSAIILLIV